MPLLRKRTVPLLVLLLAVVAACLVPATLSSVWDRGNSSRERCDGWTQNERYGDAASGATAMQRMFFAQELSDTSVLAFLTHNKRVRVFMSEGGEDRLVYSWGFSGTHYVGSECGTVFHVVHVPPAAGDRALVIIQLVPSFGTDSLALNQWVYAHKQRTSVTVYRAGEGMGMVALVFLSLYQTVPISLVWFVALVCLLFVLLLLARRKGLRQDMLYLGLFSVLVGLNFFLESQLGFLLVRNSFAGYFASTVLLAAYPMAFVRYVQKKQFLPSRELGVPFVQAVSVLDVLIVCAAAFLPMLPFSFVRIYVCAMLIAFTCYLHIVALYEVSQARRMIDGSDVAWMLVSSCMVGDFVRSFVLHDYTDIFFFSRLGVCAFVLYNVISLLVLFYDGEMTGARSAMLRLATHTDLLTGCVNIQQLPAHADEESFGIMLFSVANIRHITESKGTTEGENAIRSFAQMLRARFTGGSVYRLFSAKFCVICRTEPAGGYGGSADAVLREVQDFNDQKLGYQLQVVCTHGAYSAREGMDLDLLYATLLADLARKSREASGT